MYTHLHSLPLTTESGGIHELYNYLTYLERAYFIYFYTAEKYVVEPIEEPLLEKVVENKNMIPFIEYENLNLEDKYILEIEPWLLNMGRMIIDIINRSYRKEDEKIVFLTMNGLILFSATLLEVNVYKKDLYTSDVQPTISNADLYRLTRDYFFSSIQFIDFKKIILRCDIENYPG